MKIKQDLSGIRPLYVSAQHCAKLVNCSADKIISMAVNKTIRSYPMPSVRGKRWMWRFKEGEFLEDWDKIAQAMLATLPESESGIGVSYA